MSSKMHGIGATRTMGRHIIRHFFLAVAALFLSAVTAFAQVDWLVQLSDDGFDPFPAGGSVEYEVKVTNNGFSSAPATTIDIDIPAGGTFTGAMGGLTNCAPTPAVGPSTITCDVPPLGSLAEASMIINVDYPSDGFYTLLSTVDGQGIDIDPGNDSNPQSTTITTGSELELGITTAASSASGGILDVTFSVTNNGPDGASSSILTVPIPSGYSNIVPPAGCTLVGTNYECNVGPIADGATVDLVFSGQISAAPNSDVTFVGVVGSVDPGDPDLSNNSATADVAITDGTDLSITKDRSPDGTLLVGDEITWSLSSQYTGEDPGMIVITDTIPVNFANIMVTAPGWTCTVTGQVVSCSRPSGAGVGANIDLGDVTIVADVVSSGTAFNTAEIASDTVIDPVGGNNSDDDGGVVIEDPVVDLEVDKTGPVPNLVVVGDSYQYSISASNEGNADFFGTLVLTDVIPAGLTVDGITANGFTCTPNAVPLTGAVTVVCELDYTEASPLSPLDNTPSVVFDTTVTATGTLTNSVTVSSPNANIPDLNSDNDTITYGVGSTDPSDSADIAVVKTVDLASIPAGDVLTFTLEVTNAGPQPATNVRLTDNFLTLINDDEGPAEGYISEVIVDGLASGSSCTNSDSGARSRFLNCTFANVPICTPGSDCPTVTVQVRPGGNAGGRTNTATAFSQDVPDPTLGNNSGSVPYAVEARADVTVTKSATPDAVEAGRDVTYVIAAINSQNGLSQADDVVITDTLPADLTFVSASPSAGSCSVTPAPGSVTQAASNNILTCELGNIGNGGQRTVTVVVRPNIELRGLTFTNDVEVSTSTIETFSNNNTANEVVTVGNADLDILINKVDTVDPVAIGDDTEYVITVTNAGPSASQDLVVTDTLPTSRLSYQSVAIDAPGSCSSEPAIDSIGGTLVCEFPYLESGASFDIRVTMEGVLKGSIPNAVSVSSAEILLGDDRIAGNNMTTENTTIRTRTDIEAVSKIPTPATVNLNDNFVFTALIRVNTGVGLSEADDVEVSDILPSGMVLTGTPTVNVLVGTASEMTCTGSAGGTSFTCDLGTVSSGGEVEIEIPVEVVSVMSMPATVTNSFSVTTSSLDADPDNNTAMGDVIIGSSSIAGTIFRDFADDSNITPGDTGIGGVTVTLMGTSFDGQPIMLTTTTNPDGTYMFDFIPAGTYKVVRDPVTEPDLTQGTNSVGSENGNLTGDDTIEAITIPANTDAVNYDFAFIPQARVGIAKQLAGPIVIGADGSFTASFEMVVENLSLEAFSDVDVTDPLAGAAPLFGSYVSLADPVNDAMAFGSYTVVTPPAGSCGGNVAGYTGDAGGLTLAQNFTLASGLDCTITVSIRVMPTNPNPPLLASGGSYENQAAVEATGALSGQTSADNPGMSDLSDDGTNPDPNGNGTAGEAGEDDPTPMVPVYAPSIALVKIADRSGLSDPVAEDDELTYTFEVRNTGNVTLTDITISDPLTGIVLNNNLIASLAPGVTDTTTITATYTLTQDDVDRGFVENQATASGDDPFGTEVSDPSGDTFTDDMPLVTPFADAPMITIVKSADTSAFQSPPRPGDIVTYSFVIRNTGNVTLTDVDVTDTLVGIVLMGDPIPSMAPGDVDIGTFTATYAIDQDDINAGFVENQATVSGTPPMGPDVSDLSGTDAADDTPTMAPITQAPAIELVKMVNEDNVMEGAEVGDLLTFSFTVTNTGNLPLTNISIADALPGVIITGGPIALNPGDIDTLTFEGSYPVTAGDIAAGEVTNTATVTGSFGPDPADVVTDDSSVTASSGTLVLELVKTADTSALQSPVQVGDEITYAFAVTNAGTVVLSDVTITDTLPGIVMNGDPIPTLAVGATDTTTFTATYAVTQDDIDAGEVLNQATAVGTSPIGGTAMDLSGTAADNDDPTAAPITQSPSILLVKTVDETTLLDGAVEGELLNYSFVVTNTGNVTLTDVTITDALAGLTLLGGPIPTMAPGDVDTDTYTGSYPVTLADITEGEVVNLATVAGQFSDDLGDIVTDDSTVTAMVGTIEAISEVFPPFTEDGGTTTSMLASDLLNNEPATLDTVTITVISADPGVTLDPTTGLITLAPGLPAGPYNVEYEIGSILVPTLTDTAIETVVQGPLPSIEVEKTQEFVDNGDGRDDVGDVVNYTLVVRNTGNMPLSGVVLTDTLTDLNGAPLTLDSGPTFASSSAGSPEGELAFGETATYTASFTINLQAVNAGGVSNTVTSDAVPVYGPGVPEGPTSVTDVSDDGNDGDGDTESDPTQLLLAASVPEGGVSITKTTPLGIVQRGQIVPYTIVVSNDNPFVASPLTVVDRMPDGFLYVPDSATLDGAAVPISLSGNIVTWEGLTVLGRGSITLTVQARILNGAHAGTHTNSVRVLDGDSGEALAPPATATVRILPDPVFDCSEVIGRVFNDLDGDGYQDAPTPDTGITDQTYYGDKGDVEEVVTPRTEHGIPNVRLATVDGTIITTDANGLFSVPCAALPESGGSNFILKLDDRSLPAGFRVTSGNPRVVRLTPGMMTELNFGVAIGTVARVDLAGAAFYADGQGAAQMQASLMAGIDSLLASIDTNPTNLRLAFHVPANADAQTVSQARALMNMVENYIDDRWAALGSFPLRVEQIIVRAEP